MKNPRWYMSRRTVLRSAGASVALPFLDAMVKPGARAAGTPVRRFVGIWGFPCGVVVRERDTIQNCRVAPWTPAFTGSIVGKPPVNFGTPVGVAPYLKPFYDAKLESKISIVTGLTDRQNGVSHNCGAFLGSMPAGQDGPGVGKTGSADYAVQTLLKQQNPSIQHLVLSAARESTGATGVLRNYISWNPATPLPIDRNPRVVFEKLFGMGAAPIAVTAEAKAEAARRAAYKQTVLDAVKNDASSLLGKLGRSDKMKMDQYLTGIRDLEEQMKSAGAPAAACTDGGGTPPDSYDQAFINDNGKLDVRLKIMMDLIVKGFECDRTRVVSLMVAPAYGLNPLPHLGLSGDFHTMSHYQTDAPTPEIGMAFMTKWTTWVLQRYAYFMQELDKRTGPNGDTLLDESILHIGGEHEDSFNHDNASMQVLLGGRGGRTASGGWAVSSGRHARYPAFKGAKTSGPAMISEAVQPGERSVRDLFWAIVNIVGGSNIPAFGAATKPLDLTWADAVAS